MFAINENIVHNQVTLPTDLHNYNMAAYFLRPFLCANAWRHYFGDVYYCSGRPTIAYQFPNI